MRKRLEADDFEFCCELPAGPKMQHFGPQWPGEAVVTFPMLLGLADEHGNVDLAYAVIDRENGEAVGQLGIKGPISADGVAEIGYGMNDAVRRRGLCTEAMGALVDELLSRSEVTKVVAETAVANIASQKVLKNNAFTCTGSGWTVEDGDSLVWARTAPRTTICGKMAGHEPR